MKLYEILDTKTELSIEEDFFDNHFKASTKINNEVYTCNCLLTFIEKYISLFDDELSKDNFVKFINEANSKDIWEISFFESTKYSFNLTNIGNPLPVFSFVKQALLEFNKKYKPKYISFTSDSNSRKQLYIKLIKKSIHVKKTYVFNTDDNELIIMEI
jgi:hypothetical protein